MSNLYKKVIALLMGSILVTGLTGCTVKQLCLHPGCNNEAIEGTATCYKHRSNASVDSYKSTGNSYSNSTYKEETKKESFSYNNQTKESNSNNTKPSSETKKYKTIGVEDYDNPDDYASDFAEDFAYDEFGDDDSWEAYEYGYEATYDYWMNEMDE